MVRHSFLSFWLDHVVTNRDRIEPGYYADGRYGIRIENIVIVREAQTPNNFGDKGYLRFEHVTLVRLHCALFNLRVV